MEKVILEDKSELFKQAAEMIVGLAKDSVQDRGQFTMVLAGGNTPKTLYQLLTQPPYKLEFPWKKTHFFFGDERCVPLDHEHSNYNMANQTLFRLPELGIPKDHIYPMFDGKQTPEEAAKNYEIILKTVFNLKNDDHWPIFDLVLLGMGPDGHTLSLFPGDESHTSGYRRLVVQLYAPTGNPPGHRISLTLPTVNEARHVMFLVTGKNKRPILREIWTNQEGAKKRFPAANVDPKGLLFWLTDQEAGDIYQR